MWECSNVIMVIWWVGDGSGYSSLARRWRSGYRTCLRLMIELHSDFGRQLTGWPGPDTKFSQPLSACVQDPPRNEVEYRMTSWWGVSTRLRELHQFTQWLVSHSRQGTLNGGLPHPLFQWFILTQHRMHGTQYTVLVAKGSCTLPAMLHDENSPYWLGLQHQLTQSLTLICPQFMAVGTGNCLFTLARKSWSTSLKETMSIRMTTSLLLMA